MTSVQKRSVPATIQGSAMQAVGQAPGGGGARRRQALAGDEAGEGERQLRRVGMA